MQQEYEKYYVPAQSPWPIVGAVALFLIAVGAGNFVIESTQGEEGYGGIVLTVGIVTLLVMLFGWFKNQIDESMAGLYSAQLGRSYRQGMSWFIFSEVMFFAAFFGALYYLRHLAIPWLAETEILWPGFEAAWPSAGPIGADLLTKGAPDANAIMEGTQYALIDPLHLPLLNTAILMVSSVTLTISHHAIRANNRSQAIIWLALTVALGAIFLFFQVEEYIEAYQLLLKYSIFFFIDMTKGAGPG